MNDTAEDILAILDNGCDAYTFPMLDNGYVYPAATRLALYRSESDWALVIEVFGFAPREGIPSTYITTFASRLRHRKTSDDYINEDAYQRYLSINPHNESHSIYPISPSDWEGKEDCESLVSNAGDIRIRDTPVRPPSSTQYSDCGIELEEPHSVLVFEFCRYLAATHRELILATTEERRHHVPPELDQILQLEKWNHPDVVDDRCRPSNSEAFQQLAAVLCTGDTGLYQPTMPPNTHWSHWPEGGTL